MNFHPFWLARPDRGRVRDLQKSKNGKQRKL
jgi:hypothetical protein